MALTPFGGQRKRPADAMGAVGGFGGYGPGPAAGGPAPPGGERAEGPLEKSKKQQKREALLAPIEVGPVVVRQPASEQEAQEVHK
jgi:hypothetical protein